MVLLDNVSMIHVRRLTLCNSKKLEQAKKCHTQERLDEAQSQCSSISNVCSPNEVPAAKRLRSNLGVIHDKTKCVWCCKAESTKNPGTRLAIISYDYAWEAFKRHTVALEDQKNGRSKKRKIESTV